MAINRIARPFHVLTIAKTKPVTPRDLLSVTKNMTYPSPGRSCLFNAPLAGRFFSGNRIKYSHHPLHT
jgi:hypothetical protein